MAEDPVVQATRRYRAAQRALDARRDELTVAIGQALDRGRKQTEIVEVTGFTREHVRRLHREYERRTDAVADPDHG